MTDIWTREAAAKAFKYQREMPAHQEMIADMADLVERKPDLAIFDVGCGSGRVIEMILSDLALRPREITAIDVSPVALAYAEEATRDMAGDARIDFHQRDISAPDCFDAWADDHYDLVTAGLSLMYAQHWCDHTLSWTTLAYRRVLGDVFRLLRPGGQFVFSVDTPSPGFNRLMINSAPALTRTALRSPGAALWGFRIYLQSFELARLAKQGRYNYLPIQTVRAFLDEAGFVDVVAQPTFKGFAWAISARKPLPS